MIEVIDVFIDLYIQVGIGVNPMGVWGSGPPQLLGCGGPAVARTPTTF